METLQQLKGLPSPPMGHLTPRLCMENPGNTNQTRPGVCLCWHSQSWQSDGIGANGLTGNIPLAVLSKVWCALISCSLRADWEKLEPAGILLAFSPVVGAHESQGFGISSVPSSRADVSDISDISGISDVLMFLSSCGLLPCWNSLFFF